MAPLIVVLVSWLVAPLDWRLRDVAPGCLVDWRTPHRASCDVRLHGHVALPSPHTA